MYHPHLDDSGVDNLDFEVDQYLERRQPPAAHYGSTAKPLYGSGSGAATVGYDTLDLEGLVDSLLLGPTPAVQRPPAAAHHDDVASPAPYSAPRAAPPPKAALKTFAGQVVEPAPVDRPIRLSEGALAAAQSQFQQAAEQGPHAAAHASAERHHRPQHHSAVRREPSHKTDTSKPSSDGKGQQQQPLRVDTDLMLRRMSLWNARKGRTIEEKRKERIETEMQECTFQPLTAEGVVTQLHSPERLLRPSPLYRDNKGWGFDEFVQRQQAARQRKEEQRKYEEEVFTAGHNWTNRVTVPAPFELGKHRHRPTSSLAAGGTRHGLGISSVGAGSSRGMARIVETLRAEFDVPPSKIEPPSIPPGAFSSVSMASRTAMHHHQGPQYRQHEAFGGGGRPADWDAQIDALVQEFF